MVKVGEKAPDFELPDKDGAKHRLADYKGRKIILYFYPKDMTPGCTTEACNFRDDYIEYEDRNAIIMGVSIDSQESHIKFAEKNKLQFILLSDADKQVVKQYGVYGEKKFMGHAFIGIKRTTFVIDEHGMIKKIYKDVKVKEHSKQILADLENL